MTQPVFKPKPGQVDYTNIRYAPVVNTIATKDGKILLVKRSQDLKLYPGYWNGISGFLDDHKSIDEKVVAELKEELGITKQQIVSLSAAEPLLQEAPEYKKTWLVVPVLVKINTSEFRLDWEAQQARWVTPKQATKLKLMPGFSSVLARFYP